MDIQYTDNLYKLPRTVLVQLLASLVLRKGNSIAYSIRKDNFQLNQQCHQALGSHHTITDPDGMVIQGIPRTGVGYLIPTDSCICTNCHTIIKHSSPMYVQYLPYCPSCTEADATKWFSFMQGMNREYTDIAYYPTDIQAEVYKITLDRLTGLGYYAIPSTYV
jgi:hypothetical protein